MQVKAGDARYQLRWLMQLLWPQNLMKKRETRLSCDQAAFVQKTGPGWGVQKGEMPEISTNKPILLVPLAGLSLAMPVLLCHPAPPCLQFPNFRVLHTMVS